MEKLVNTPVTIPFVTSVSKSLTTIQAGILTLVDGVLRTPAPTYSLLEIGGGVYTLTFTPSVTGEWAIFIEGGFQASLSVVSVTTTSLLQDLYAAGLGSWTWDKQTGVLTVFCMDGTPLNTYTVVETDLTASRELVGAGS